MLAYGSTRVWASKIVPAVANLKNVSIAVLAQEPLGALASELGRTIEWSVMISDGVLYVSDANTQHEFVLEWLMGER